MKAINENGASESEDRPAAESKAVSVTIALTIAIVQAVAIAVLNDRLVGRTETLIKQQEQRVSAAEKMQPIIDKLFENHKDSEYAAHFLQLTLFGVDAIEPMGWLAAVNGNYKSEYPINGLRILEKTNHERTCDAIGRITSNGKEMASFGSEDRLNGLIALQKELKCVAS